MGYVWCSRGTKGFALACPGRMTSVLCILLCQWSSWPTLACFSVSSGLLRSLSFVSTFCFHSSLSLKIETKYNKWSIPLHDFWFREAPFPLILKVFYVCLCVWVLKGMQRTWKFKYIHIWNLISIWALVTQMVKHLPTMQETQVWSLGWEDNLEKEIATHSSTLAWKIPRMEEPGRL